MNLGQISSHATPPLPPSMDVGRAGAGASKDLPFSHLVSQFIHDADQQQHAVTQDVHRLITGETDNVHDVAISIAKADVAFRMLMEVRDQLIRSYQEVMRMQV